LVSLAAQFAAGEARTPNVAETAIASREANAYKLVPSISASSKTLLPLMASTS
jgi:hypothetical protein